MSRGKWERSRMAKYMHYTLGPKQVKLLLEIMEGDKTLRQIMNTEKVSMGLLMSWMDGEEFRKWMAKVLRMLRKTAHVEAKMALRRLMEAAVAVVTGGTDPGENWRRSFEMLVKVTRPGGAKKRKQKKQARMLVGAGMPAGEAEELMRIMEGRPAKPEVRNQNDESNPNDEGQGVVVG